MGKELTRKKEDAPTPATPAAAAPGLARFGDDKGIPVEAGAVAKFLQQRVLRAQCDGTGGKARLCIRHTVNGRVGDRVDEAQLADPEQLTEEMVGKLAVEICKCAANDAENRGRGPQRYTLQWYTFEEPTENPFVLSFEVKTGKQVNSGASEYVDSYPATPEGVSGMLMKRIGQLDDLILDLIPAMAAPVTAMKGMLDASLADNAALRMEIRANSKEVTDAKEAAWQRTEASANAAAKRDMWGEVTKGVKLMAPAIAKRVGLIDKNQPIAADNAHIIAVVQSLVNRDALGTILSSDLLTDEEKGHIVSTVQAHLETDDETLDAPKSGNGKRNGANGTAREHGDGRVPSNKQVAAAPAAKLTPAQELEVAEAQLEAWRVKRDQLKACVPPPAAEA